MKNLLALLAFAGMCTALVPATALAENGPISGSFTVTYTGGVVGNPPICNPNNSVYVEAHGIGNATGALGTMMLTIRKCYNYVAGTYEGTFALSSPDGRDTVTGTVRGVRRYLHGAFPQHLLSVPWRADSHGGDRKIQIGERDAEIHGHGGRPRRSQRNRVLRHRSKRAQLAVGTPKGVPYAGLKGRPRRATPSGVPTTQGSRGCLT